MTAEDIRSRGESRLADARKRLAKLESDPPRDRDALLGAVDELQLALVNAASEVGVLKEVHPDVAAREACEAIQVESTKLGVLVAQSRPIYDALSSIDLDALDATVRRAVELTLRDMKRAGVALDEATRDKAQALRATLTTLSHTYGRNIRDDVRTVTIPASALDGMPADYRSAHPADAQGMVRVTTDPPDMSPLMAYSRDKAARRALAQAYYDRARENLAVFEELRAARHELATTLGYRSWAEYNLEDKMAASPANVDAFLPGSSRRGSRAGAVPVRRAARDRTARRPWDDADRQLGHELPRCAVEGRKIPI
jgi:thimet oligopeptidase